MLVKRGSKAGTLMRELPIGKRTKRGLPADVAVSWMAEHGRAWEGGGQEALPSPTRFPLEKWVVEENAGKLLGLICRGLAEQSMVPTGEGAGCASGSRVLWRKIWWRSRMPTQAATLGPSVRHAGGRVPGGAAHGCRRTAPRGRRETQPGATNNCTAGQFCGPTSGPGKWGLFLGREP